jgi:hypothetical protein
VDQRTSKVGCHAVAVRLWRLQGENLIVATRTHGVRAITQTNKNAGFDW